MNTEELLAAAREQTGLSDLGDDSILHPLGRLVDALNSEAALNERGVHLVFFRCFKARAIVAEIVEVGAV